jgi:DNA-binding GntR family transcriptional regulator
MGLNVIESGREPEGITMSSPVPASLRQKIIDDLIEAVRSGELEPGAPIPSAAKLMAEYKCSITPVRAAIENLKTRGLLVGAAGRAVFVAKPLPPWMLTLQSHSSG